MRRFLVLLFLTSNLAFAQLGSSVETGYSYSFQIYDPSSGFDRSHVNSIIEDTYGRLWIGSDEGLTIFNGSAFKKFSEADGLAGTSVQVLLKSEEDEVWIGTTTGLTQFDGVNFIIHNDFDGISIRDISKSKDGTYWVVSDQGFYKSEDGNWTRMFVADLGGKESEASSILIEEDKIWLGVGNRLYSAKGTDVSLEFEIVNGEAPVVTELLRSKSGELFAAFNRGGLLRIDGDEMRFFDGKNSKCRTQLRALYESADGTIWLGSETGLQELRDTSFVTITQINGLRSNDIRCFLTDSENNFWMGTHGGGFVRFANSAFIHYDEMSGILHPTPFPIIEVGTALWLGTKDGIAILDKNQFSSITTADGLASNSIHGMFQDSQGRIWIGRKDGSSVIENGIVKNIPTPEGKEPTRTYVFLEDDQGEIWSGSGHGLLLFNGERFEEPYSEDQGPAPVVKDMTFDPDGEIWMTALKGVRRTMGGEIHGPEIFGEFIDHEAFSIVFDELGRAWLATYDDGVFVIENGKSSFHLSTNVGLPNKSAVSLLIDEGTAWIGTNNGLVRVDYADTTSRLGYTRLENGWQMRVYNSENGFAGVECNQNSLYKSNKGELWIGATDRLTRFLPEAETINEMAPETYLDVFKVFHEQLDWDVQTDEFKLKYTDKSNPANFPDEITLNHDQNHITIGFFGSSLSNPKNNRFKYRMIGISDDWSPPTNLNEAVFPILNAGTYQFEVTASNNEGVWDPSPAKLKIVILAPWWEATWFKMAVVLLGILLVGGWFYFYFRIKQRRLNQEHETIKLEQRLLRSQMNPHFIFNSLNTIQSFIYGNDSAQAGSYLGKFSKLIRLVLENSRSEYITVSKELELLRLYIELQQLRFEKPFQFELKIDPEIFQESTGIPPMLAQPFIENAIEHGIKNMGDKGELHISFQQEENHILLLVTDNGVGFEKSQQSKDVNQKDHHSLATEITNERLANFNRMRDDKLTVKIEDLATSGNSGTRVEFTIPIVDIYAKQSDE